MFSELELVSLKDAKPKQFYFLTTGKAKVKHYGTNWFNWHNVIKIFLI